MNLNLYHMLLENYYSDHLTYIIDRNTCEIIYMEGIDENINSQMIGEKCYEVIYGKNKPCEFCNYGCPKGGHSKIKEWDFHNLYSGKWYMSYEKKIHWLKRKNLTLKMLIDVTDLKKMELKNYHLLFSKN